MKSVLADSLLGALLGALLLGASPALAADQVSGQSFDRQTKTITEELQIQQEQGVFGRAGSSGLSQDGRAGRSVGDRDFDRYVQRLGYQMRLYNDRISRDPAGFQ